MKREPSHRTRPQKEKETPCCLICGNETDLQSYVYLPIWDQITLKPLCILHDNSHRIVGNEKEIFKGCGVAGCFYPRKALNMCKKHYDKAYIQ